VGEADVSSGTATGRPRHTLRAIVSMIGAVAAFAGMDALLKVFSTAYPAMEVAALRGAADRHCTVGSCVDALETAVTAGRAAAVTGSPR